MLLKIAWHSLLLLVLLFPAAAGSAVRIIITESREEAEATLAEAAKGRPFAVLAKERSLDERSRDHYGELDDAAVAGLPESLRGVISGLPEGGTSGVVQTDEKRFAVAHRVDFGDYRKGSRLFRSGEYGAAEISLLRFMELNPDAVKARWMLGRIYESRKETAKAELFYSEAIAHNPSFEEAYASLGALHLKMKEFGKAADLYMEGLKHLPGSTPLREGLAKASVLPGKETGKQKAGKARSAEAVKPDRPSGQAEASSPPEERTVHLRIILAADEKEAGEILAEIRSGRSFALLAAEKSTDPVGRKAYGYLGEVKVSPLAAPLRTAVAGMKEGDTSGVIALDDGRYALLQVSNARDLAEGEKAFITGDYPAAEKSLLRYVELNPDSVKALTMLGKVYEDTKEIVKAEEMYKRALSFGPREILVYERLGRIYLFQGRLREAKELYETGLRNAPGSAALEKGLEIADILLIGKGRLPAP